MVSHLYIYISFLQGEPAQFQQNVLPSNLYTMALFNLTHQTSKETSSNNGDMQFMSPKRAVSIHMRTKPKSDRQRKEERKRKKEKKQTHFNSGQTNGK
jgi:hypothetical protein